MSFKKNYIPQIFRGRTFTGILLAMTATVSWASLCVVGRYLFGTESGNCNAFVISTFRNLIGGSLMIVFLSFRRELPKVAEALKTDWKSFAALGFIGSALEGTLQIWSLEYTTAARCSLFANTAPIYTLIIAHFALKEPFNRKNVTGLCAGMLGVLIAAGAEGNDVFASGRMLLGDMLALSSGICWAVFTVYGVKVTRRWGGLVSAALITLFASLLQLPVGLWLLPASLPMSWQLAAGIIYMGIFTAGIANICWMSALKYLSAGATGAFGYASFGLAVIFSVIFLGEKLTAPVLIAIVLIVGGIEQMLAGGKKKA